VWREKMKTFECQACKHIAFDEAPVECPVCGKAIENFENEPDAIKKPADPDNLSESDRKHIPQIILNRECNLNHDETCIIVQVKIGEIEHVMETEHFINFIDIYVDRKYVTRAMFTPKKMHPAVNLHLNVSTGMLSVIAHCNVHGNWRAKVKLDEK
jgi:superoxide reductase